MKVKKTRIFSETLGGTFGSLWFYEAGDSLVLFHFPFLSSDKILMQQNMIHTISKDFWQWKCQNIRQQPLVSDILAARYRQYPVTKLLVPAEGPRTFWTSLDFASKESTPEKVPNSGNCDYQKQPNHRKPTNRFDIRGPPRPDMVKLKNGKGVSCSLW